MSKRKVGNATVRTLWSVSKRTRWIWSLLLSGLGPALVAAEKEYGVCLMTVRETFVAWFAYIKTHGVWEEYRGSHQA